MMKKLSMPLAACLFLLAGSTLLAGGKELKTVEMSADVIHHMAEYPLKCIQPALLCNAHGVAIIPHVVKAGLVVDGEFGRGVVLVRQPDGCWSNPVFVTLSGGGVGLQAGVESTDVVLVFKTRHSLDRILQGKNKLVLGTDVAIAAGPLGRDAEAATDAKLKAEIYSYSRSRGLFAGLSLEGAKLFFDREANDVFYNLHGCHPADVLALRGFAAVDCLQKELVRLSSPPPPPPPVYVRPRPVPPQLWR